MGYNASVSGSLTPRAGKSEEEIEETLLKIPCHFEFEFPETFEDHYVNKGVIRVYSDGDKYYEEDYNDMSKVFDGQINFLGDDGVKWSLFLKDGSVKKTVIFEVLPKPDETAEQTIGRYIVENGLNPRKVLEGMPEFIAAKLWFKEDVVNKADEVGITEEAQKEILDRAIDLIDKEQLESYTDGEENAIETGLKTALDEYREKLKEVV